MKRLLSIPAALAAASCATAEPPLAKFEAACATAPSPERCVESRVVVWEQRQAQQAAEARRRIGMALMAMSSGGGYVAPQSSLSAPTHIAPTQGPTGGMLVSNYVSGMNRVCTYNTASGVTTAVVGAANICPLSPPSNAGQPSGRSSTGFFEREYVQGMNRVCVYDTVRGEEVITVSAASVCPISLPN